MRASRRFEAGAFTNQVYRVREFNMQRTLWGLIFVASSAFAAPVAIVTYDIRDAAVSGWGGWSHAYTGTVSPTGTFFNGGGVVANYSGGAGTLNDGVIGVSINDTQLFFQGATDMASISMAPTIKLARPTLVSKILISGGNIGGNFFPGMIEGVTVEIGGQSAALTTIPSGQISAVGIPVDDTADLTGTPLASIVTDTITLRDFVVSSMTGGQFIITELSVDGAAPTRAVRVDVKPGNPNNRIHLAAARVRVAVLSSATFDARSIDPLSLRFGRTGEEASLVECQLLANGSRDRLPDLVCKFSIARAGFVVGDKLATLTGKTRSGEAFSGTDAITVVRGGNNEQDCED
jgi:hypothetical protein